MVLSTSQRGKVAVRPTGGELDERCLACGHSISPSIRLPVCPVCHQRAWRPAPPTFRVLVGAWAARSSSSSIEQEVRNDVRN
jgi:hypothetical protein